MLTLQFKVVNYLIKYNFALKIFWGYNMRILIAILSIIIFIKTFSYGLYELKTNKNKTAGITLFSFAFLALIFPNLIIFIRGI